jgi:hypothetical protein
VTTDLERIKELIEGTLPLIEVDREIDPVELKGDDELLRAQVDSLKAETRIKVFLSRRTYNYLKWWTRYVCLIILLQGFSKFTNFGISDTVLVVVVGSTTASVIGLLLAMITGLFGGKRSQRLSNGQSE